MTTRLQQSFNNTSAAHVSLESHPDILRLSRELDATLIHRMSVSTESEGQSETFVSKAREIIKQIWEKIVAMAKRVVAWIRDNTVALERRLHVLSAKIKETTFKGSFSVDLPEEMARWYQPSWQAFAENTMAGFVANGERLFKMVEELAKVEAQSGFESPTYHTHHRQVMTLVDQICKTLIDRHDGLGGRKYKRPYRDGNEENPKRLGITACVTFDDGEVKPKTHYQFTSDTLLDLVVDAERDLKRVSDNAKTVEEFFEDIVERGDKLDLDRSYGAETMIQHARLASYLQRAMNEFNSQTMKAISKRGEIANYILRNYTSKSSSDAAE